MFDGIILTSKLVAPFILAMTGERQSTDLQKDALVKIGVDPRNIYEDRASRPQSNRPGLASTLAFLQPGDCLIVGPVWNCSGIAHIWSYCLTQF